MALWTIHSNTRKTYLYSIIMGAVGVMFMALTYDRRTESVNTQCAFYLGVFLFALAWGVFMYFEDTTVQIDENNRRLIFIRKSKLQSRTYIRRFDEIESINITQIGRTRTAMYHFHLYFKLKDGSKETPGIFDYERSQMLKLAEKLSSSIGCKVDF